MNIMYKTEKYLNIIMAAVLAISLMTAGVSEGFFALNQVQYFHSIVFQDLK